jgi:hypothetical protein
MIDGSQGEQWISDKLSRTVIRHVAAAVDPMDFDRALGLLFFVPEQVFRPAAPAKGKAMRVFKQQQGRWASPSGNLFCQTILKLPGLFVCDKA